MVVMLSRVLVKQDAIKLIIYSSQQFYIITPSLQEPIAIVVLFQVVVCMHWKPEAND